MLNLQVTLKLDGLNLHAHAPGFADPKYLDLFLSMASIGPHHLTILRPTP